MNTNNKLNLLKIECTRAIQKNLESVFDFKIKNQDLSKCKFVVNIRILSEKQFNIDDFGDAIMELKKFNTIQKHSSLDYKILFKIQK
jgi:hypothetical protein